MRHYSFVIVDKLESGSVYYFKKRKRDAYEIKQIAVDKWNCWHFRRPSDHLRFLNRWQLGNYLFGSHLVENPGWGDMVTGLAGCFWDFPCRTYHYSNDPRVNKTSHELSFCASITGFISSYFSDFYLSSQGILYLLVKRRNENEPRLCCA